MTEEEEEKIVPFMIWSSILLLSFPLYSICQKGVTKYSPHTKGKEISYIFWKEACQNICEYILDSQSYLDFFSLAICWDRKMDDPFNMYEVYVLS